MAIPVVSLTYDLADVATSIGTWFASFWGILAFSIAIPMAFLIAHNVKGLFR